MNSFTGITFLLGAIVECCKLHFSSGMKWKQAWTEGQQKAISYASPLVAAVIADDK